MSLRDLLTWISTTASSIVNYVSNTDATTSIYQSVSRFFEISYVNSNRLLEQAINIPIPKIEKWMMRDNYKVHLLGDIPTLKYEGLNKPESICKYVLDAYFNCRFEQVYVPFIINPKTGRKLQLDLYNGTIICGDYIGLGLEYQGYQHYHYPNHYHRSSNAFNNAVERDKYKRMRCKEEKARLIEMPYTVKYSDIPIVLINILDRLGYQSLCQL